MTPLITDTSPHPHSPEPIGWMIATELAGWGGFWVLVGMIVGGCVLFATVATFIEAHKARQAGKRREGKE